MGGAAGAGLLLDGVGGAVEVRRRSRSGSGGVSGWRSRLPVSSSRSRRWSVGGASVLPAALIGGEAAVNQQRKFRNRRLNSPSLKQKTPAGERRYSAVLLLLAVCGDIVTLRATRRP